MQCEHNGMHVQLRQCQPRHNHLSHEEGLHPMALVTALLCDGSASALVSGWASSPARLLKRPRLPPRLLTIRSNRSVETDPPSHGSGVVMTCIRGLVDGGTRALYLTTSAARALSRFASKSTLECVGGGAM